MWSPFYFYFEIRPDNSYSQSIHSGSLINYLVKEMKFLMEGPDSFKQKNQMPWFNLLLTRASQNGSFRSHDKCPEKINILSIVGDKRSGNRNDYIELFLNIAKWLKWEFIEETDGDGSENVSIWAPEERKIN